MTTPAENAPRAGRLRTVFGNLGWLLASNGVMAALSLIYVGIATRTLGVKEFGRFALITGASQTLAALVGFETWRIIVQYGVEHAAKGEHGALWRLEKAGMTLELAGALIGIVGLAILFAVSPQPFGLKDAVYPFAFGYAAIQLMTFRSTLTGILRLHDRFHLAAVADATQSVGRLLGATWALFYWPSVTGFLIGYAAAEVMTTAVYWGLVARLPDMRAMLRAPLDRRALLRENPGLLNLTLSSNLQPTLGLAARQIPLLLVGGFAGPTAAGAFRLALQLSNALSKLSALLTRAAFPELVRSIRAVHGAGLGRLIGRIMLAAFAGGIVVMVLVVLLGRPLLTLVGGKEFGIAYVLLLWLTAAGCVELAAAAIEPVLLALHRAGAAMLARGCAVAIQLMTMVVLLPLADALGASISIFLGSVAALVLLGASLIRVGRAPSPAP